jgi:hypothetical protein
MALDHLGRLGYSAQSTTKDQDLGHRDLDFGVDGGDIDGGCGLHKAHQAHTQFSDGKCPKSCTRLAIGSNCPLIARGIHIHQILQSGMGFLVVPKHIHHLGIHVLTTTIAKPNRQFHQPDGQNMSSRRGPDHAQSLGLQVAIRLPCLDEVMGGEEICKSTGDGREAPGVYQ